MATSLYEFLRVLGYHHPLHPAFTHVPVGLTIASFVFMFLAFILKGSSFGQTAKHCVVLALLSTIPTVVTGYFDWQMFYGGAFIFPIIMKLILAAILLVLLVILTLTVLKNEQNMKRRFLIHFLSLLIVAGIGYYGGELVYGQKTSSLSPEKVNESIADGVKLFNENCSFCHYTDRKDTKVGPGLKELFQEERLPVSNKPVSAETIQQQLETPFKEMPSFKRLTPSQINSLTDYLKTL